MSSQTFNLIVSMLLLASIEFSFKTVEQIFRENATTKFTQGAEDFPFIGVPTSNHDMLCQQGDQA